MPRKPSSGGLEYEKWKDRYAGRRVVLYVPDASIRDGWGATARSEGIPLNRWILNRILSGMERAEDLNRHRKELRSTKSMEDTWHKMYEEAAAEVVRLTADLAARDRKLAGLEAIVKAQVGGGTEPPNLIEAMAQWFFSMYAASVRTFTKDRFFQAAHEIVGFLPTSVGDREPKPLSPKMLKVLDLELEQILSRFEAAGYLLREGKRYTLVALPRGEP